MTSKKREKRLDDVLTEYAIEHLDWPKTSQEIDQYLESFTDDTAHSDSHHNLAQPRPRAGSASDAEPQPLLWPSNGYSGVIGGEHRLLTLADVVHCAYLKVYDGWSIDRVVTDPDRSALFVRACWSLGAQASQYELNRTLLNSRKSGLLSGIEGVQRFSVSREQLDRYTFASEAAIRALQDEEFFSNQRFVSPDQILCDPALAKRFDAGAREIAPGHTSFDYRWAVLIMRKGARRRIPCPQLKLSMFDSVGSGNSVRPSRLNPQPGFYWMRCGDNYSYVGHAQNLKTQISQLLDSRLHRVPFLDRVLNASRPSQIEYAVSYHDGMSASGRDVMKGNLVNQLKPILNFLSKRGLESEVAKTRVA